MRYILSKCRKVYRERGAIGLGKKIWQKLFGKSEAEIYEKIQRDKSGLYAAWRKKHGAVADELNRQRQLSYADFPLIGIVVPVYNTKVLYLTEFIESVLAQTSPNWELCLVDGCSDAKDTKETLARYAAKDKRIHVLTLTQNNGISGNTNEGLRAVRGEFILFCDHDDVLEPNALYEVNMAIKNHHADVVYSDEDKINDDSSLYYEPHLKPDYSPEKLTACNYFCHLMGVSRQLFEKVGYLNPAFDGSQDHEFTLRACDAAANDKIIHIPRVLYHWRQFGASMSKQHLEKCQAAGRRAVGEHLARIGLTGTVTQDHGYRVNYAINRQELISVIVAVKDDIKAAGQNFAQLKQASSYPCLEFILINLTPDTANGESFDGVTYVTGDTALSAYANINRAAQEANGVYLALADEYLTCNNPAWAEELVMYAQQPTIGMVGGKIYLPDNEHIFATDYLLTKGGPVREFFGHSRNVIGDGGQERMVRNVSALPCEMLLLRREVFPAAGGLDEKYRNGLGEIDLALRLLGAGYRHVTTPFAEMRLTKTAVTDKFMPMNTPDGRYFLSHGKDYVYDRYNRIPFDATDLEEAEL